LAHAYIFMAAPFAAYYHLLLGMESVRSAIVLGVALATLLGVALYSICSRPIPHSHDLSRFVTSLSFGVIIQVVIVNTFGTLKLPFNPGLALSDIEIGSVILSGVQAAGLVVSILLMIYLLWLVRRSRFGRNVRAIAENEHAAQLLGVSV